MQPANRSCLSTSGTTAISLVSSGTSRSANANPAAVAQTLTMVTASLPWNRSCDPRSTFPSSDTTSSPFNSVMARTQLKKQRWKVSGASRLNNRPNVSCEGQPCRSFQPIRFRPAEQLHMPPVIGSADYANDGHDDDLDQQVVLAAILARIC